MRTERVTECDEKEKKKTRREQKRRRRRVRMKTNVSTPCVL